MPKEKKTTSNRLQSYVTEFGTEIFSTDNKILFCKVCNTKVSSEKRFSITQHIAAKKHRKFVNALKKKMINLNSFYFKILQQNRHSKLIYVKLC